MYTVPVQRHHTPTFWSVVAVANVQLGKRLYSLLAPPFIDKRSPFRDSQDDFLWTDPRRGALITPE